MVSMMRKPATGAAFREAAGRRALVMEDAPEVLDLLREVLESEGFAVTASADPFGIEEVIREAPDLIVLDVLFGHEERGIELLRRLRAEEATAAIPVVLCSGATEPIRRIEGPLLEGATGLVLKPFDVDVLLEEIARVLPDATDEMSGSARPAGGI